MLGTRLKSWMEAHIVRARKKHNRKGKTDKSASAGQQDEASDSKAGGCSARKDSEVLSVGEGAAPPSMTPDGSKSQPQDASKVHLPSDSSKTHLSSPESAYSTGYSTDGTSPGASIPPEYYINLRTGKHYVQASTGNAGVSGAETVAPRAGLVVARGAPPPAPPTSPRAAPNLTPSSARRRREEALKRKKQEGNLPESSTEEDIAKPPSHKITTPKSQRKPNAGLLSHRRTESYDENSQRYRIQVPIYSVIDRDSEGSSSTRTTGGSSSIHSGLSNNNNTSAPLSNNNNNNNNNNYGRPTSKCGSPFLSSSAAASPRQRNRIRTNPWLGGGGAPGGCGLGVGTAPLAAPENDPSARNYSSQGDTSSTVGSSSTLSSAGRLELSGHGSGSGGPGGGTSVASSPLSRLRCPPPPPGDLVRIVRSGTYLASPLANGRRAVEAVTTCSPQPNRPCRHSRPHKNSTLSLSSSSTPTSEDDGRASGRRAPSGTRGHSSHRTGSSPSPSDLSEDDLTLNEMGKYDESYVYEKETDILSDSDPTDCDDPQHNHRHSHSGKVVNKGHCTYVGGFGTPESSVKMKRRSRPRRQKSDDRASSGQLTRNVSEGSRRSHSGSNVSTPTRRCRRRRSARATPVYDEAPLAESPVMARASLRGRSPNLNRLLVERLMTGGRASPQPQAPLGSRSADCTPISLRKHHHHHHHHHHAHHHHQQPELNGKVLKNPHVSKLISSSNCPSPSMEPKYREYSPVLVKKRSNSLSVSGSYFGAPYQPPPARAVDEGDLKYRRLIREAENLIVTEQHVSVKNLAKTPPSALSPFHKTGYSPRNLGKPVPVPTLPPPPPYSPYCPEIESAINNNSPPRTGVFHPEPPKTTPRQSEDGNFLKTISKTLERIMIRNNKKSKTSGNSPANHEVPNEINSNHPNTLTYRTLGGMNRLDFNDDDDMIAVTIQPQSSSDVTNHNEEPCYVNNIVGELHAHNLRLVDRDNNDNVFPGPTFTTFGRGNGQASPTPRRDAIVQRADEAQVPARKPNRKLGLTLWKEGQAPNRDKLTRKDEAVSTPKTPIIPFEAFQLVTPKAEVAPPVTSPLPQSEPVKRKVYACSSSFDRLQKSLVLRGEHDPEHVAMLLKHKYSTDPADVAAMSTEALRDENLSLKEKVEQLRRRRLEVEERVRSTQAQIDRLRAADVSKPQFLP